MITKNNNEIGCCKCRQFDDCDNELGSKLYDAGWLGQVESSLMLSNATSYMQADGSYKTSDKAFLSFSIWKSDKSTGVCDQELICEEYEIKFCPYCGANLKEVRDYVRSLESEDE